MDILEIREFVISLPMVEECQPFGDDVVVYKVGGRMFCCCMLPRSEYIAVKCHPDRAIQLRDEFSAVTPAYHFNKKHWNDLLVTLLPPDVIKREIIHSYMLVIRSNVTPKALRQELLDIVAEAGIRDTAEIVL